MTIAVTEAAKLSLTIDISAKAIDFIERQHNRRYSQSNLNDAYADWKEGSGITHRIEPDSDEWKLMMAATKAQYEELEEAKRQEKNSEKRLRTAVFKLKAIQDEERGRDAGLVPVPADENNGLHNANLLAEHLP